MNWKAAHRATPVTTSDTEMRPLNGCTESCPAIEDVENPMVILIGIGDYQTYKQKDPKLKSADLENAFQDFPVRKDMDNLRQTFGLLNYKTLPQEKNETRYWSEKSLLKFLDRAGAELVTSLDEDGPMRYDGLIVCISCHGIRNHIITSDYKAIHKTAIHRIFSVKHRKCRAIPRMFIFDCCEGPQSCMGQNEGDTEDGMEGGRTKEYAKYFGMEHLEESQIWTVNEPNPDYKLMEIHAANVGFEAKCNTKYGSYLLYEFAKCVEKDLENGSNQTRMLGRIFERIQNDLHSKGKQQTINVFNNNTRYIRLRKHETPVTSIEVS